MRRHRYSYHAILLLVVVLILTLSTGADAKKRRKKHKAKKRPSHAAAPTAWSQPPAESGATASSLRGAVVNCDPIKEQYRQVIEKYSGVNKDIVDKHNKLVTEYNVLLRSHSDLIKRFNSLVTELEDPSLAQFLAAKAVKTYHHPGIEGAVNKTYIHVMPVANDLISKGHTASQEWFNRTQSSVQQFLETYGGEGSQEWAPAISGWIVYGSVLIPVSIACSCVLELVCKLHQLILFGHVYLAVSGMLMASFALSTGEDPLSTFAEQDPKLYQFAQCAFAVVFVLYGVISSVALCCTDSNGVWRTLHVFVIVAFGGLYYLLVWTPAMMDELPRVDDFVESAFLPDITRLGPGAAKPEDEDVPRVLTVAPYLVIAIVFSMLFLFESSSSKVVKPEDAAHSD